MLYLSAFLYHLYLGHELGYIKLTGEVHVFLQVIEKCIYDEHCIETKFNFAGALRFMCGQADFCRLG